MWPMVSSTVKQPKSSDINMFTIIVHYKPDPLYNITKLLKKETHHPVIHRGGFNDKSCARCTYIARG